MHELRRRSYLESMGIDSYISRTQLPGAAPTRRLAINRRSQVPSALSDSQPDSTIVGVSATKTAFREAAETVRAQLDDVRTPSVLRPAASVSAAAVPPFSIVAVVVGDWLWLEELSQPAVSRNQVHLIRSMSKALALEVGELDVSQFDWPIHRNAQLDLGEDAARAGLGGFVQGKTDRRKCRGVIFLGSGCQQKLDISQLELGQCVSTVSTAEMLRDPQLKKQAWRDLLPIANRP